MVISILGNRLEMLPETSADRDFLILCSLRSERNLKLKKVLRKGRKKVALYFGEFQKAPLVLVSEQFDHFKSLRAKRTNVYGLQISRDKGVFRQMA